MPKAHDEAVEDSKESQRNEEKREVQQLQVSRSRVPANRVRETDCLVKEITMDRIECVNGDDQLFASHRDRLMRIASRMLRSRVDAEDLVQDVYLRWHQAGKHGIRSPSAFLVTITTRLCLDRLRERKRQRAESTDPWRSEPAVDERMPSPEMQLEFSEEVSIALVAVLERLGPAERVAFLLHEVFDYEYPEVGTILRKTEPACRQMIHRARARLRNSRARFAVTQKIRERVLKKFRAAVGTADREAVLALLAEEVEVHFYPNPRS